MKKSVQAIAKSGGNPQEVVHLIERILRTKRPKFRYPIGKGVKGLLFAKAWLPWSMVEKAVAKRFR